MNARVAVVLKTNQGGTWVLPQIRALREAGCECVLIVPGGGGKLVELAVADSIPTVELDFDFSFSRFPAAMKGIRELRRKLDELRVDVVVYHLYASALASRLASLGRGYSRVHVVPGPLFLEFLPVRLVESFLVGLDDLLVSGSEYTYREYERLRGLRPGRHVMIPYGVDVEARKPPVGAARRDARYGLGIEEKAFVAVIVAYFYSPKKALGHGQGLKGHETLLSAWDSFSKAHPDAVLLVVGGGFDEAGEEYRQQLRRGNNVPSVRWVETAADVSCFYHAADVSISPSLSENHGAAMEANAYGIPSIVTDVGGLPEMVNKHSGWLVDPGDIRSLHAALKEAYDEWSSGELATRGAAARQHCESLYSNRETSKQLAAEVTRLSRGVRPVVLFSEARVQRDQYGRWSSADSVNGDEVWQEFVDELGYCALAARHDQYAPGEAPGALISSVEVIGLESYRGLNHALRSFPRLSKDVIGAVRRSRGVVARLPGPVGMLAVAASTVMRRPLAVELLGDPRDVASSGALGAVGKHLGSVLALLTALSVRQAESVHYVTDGALQACYPPGRRAESSAFSDVSLPEIDVDVHPRSELCSGERLKMLAVGSQSNNYKRHDVVIKAAAFLRNNGLPVHLTIVGQGGLHDSLVLLARNLGLSEHVTFVKFIDRPALLDLMRDQDILLHPSATEGLPRVVVEAMSTGLPVVATNVGGLAELVRPDCVVPIGSPEALAKKILNAISDDCYEELSRFSLATAKRFSPSSLEPKKKVWFNSLRRIFDDER